MRVAIPIVIVLIAFPASATERDHSPELMELLRGIDVVPSAADLSRVSAEPQADLFRVALDTVLPLYPRRRAVSLLSAFPDATGEAYLTMIATVAAHPRLRWIAIYTYTRSWGSRAPGRVADFAARVLDSPLPLDREAAVLGLRWVDTERASALLETQRTREKHKTVLAALEKVRKLR